MKSEVLYGEKLPRTVIDTDGNKFLIIKEIGRGGQGVVYATDDPSLAVKQPILPDGAPDRVKDLGKLLSGIRSLPLPPLLHITSPLAILQNEPGYVMQHMEGRLPIARFDVSEFEDYKQTRGGKIRLEILASVAVTLARLHAAGLVYGDISANNIYADSADAGSTWLIDPDNLRFETLRGGSSFFTPGYGAPEIVRGEDVSRPVSDVWAFAVLAFRLLTMCEPFIGAAVLDDDSGDAWDVSPTDPGESMETQAYAGMLPFIDDPNDDTNRCEKNGRPLGLPRELVLTDRLAHLFKVTFCEGRTAPWQRPAMLEFAKALQCAADRSIVCRACGLSYFGGRFNACPWCDARTERFCVAESRMGKCLILQQGVLHNRYLLPERLFGGFYPASHNETSYEVQIDFTKKTALPVRGSKALPDGLTFRFVGE